MKANELTIARFIKRLSSNIANKVKLQPYLSFDDACNLAIKIEKQLKSRKSFKLLPQTATETPSMVSPPIAKLTLPLYPLMLLTKVKGLLTKHQSYQRERCSSGTTALDISKWIIPT